MWNYGTDLDIPEQENIKFSKSAGIMRLIVILVDSYMSRTRVKLAKYSAASKDQHASTGSIRQQFS